MDFSDIVVFLKYLAKLDFPARPEPYAYQLVSTLPVLVLSTLTLGNNLMQSFKSLGIYTSFTSF